MLAKLKGLIDETEEDSATLDVGGVGYRVFCSARHLQTLAPDQAVALFIDTQVREDHIHLYGFPNAVEREWFRLLVTVQRVGNRMALAILSAYPPAQLAQVLLAKDIRALSAISGVGPKLAERIVTELKDKVAKLPTSGFTVTPGKAAPTDSGINEDAISALTHLGYSRTEAYNAIANAQVKQPDATLDALIKLGLQELMR